jgi:hypothetical protein
MTEPFFASGSPVWSGTPSGALAWPQITQIPGFLQGTPSMNLFALDPSQAAFAAARRPYGPGATAPTPAATLGGLPSLTPGPETATGVSPSMLLGAIALRRGQPQGPASDQDIEEFMYDALELLWGTNEVEVRSEQGRVTLTGSVQHKRLKRDIGEIAWAIAAVADVQNNVTIAARRRSRSAGREASEASPSGAARKQA